MKKLVYLLTLLLIMVMNANGQLTNGIAAYWKLDEISGSIVNDSYSSNDGTVTNATINQTGILGNGVSFDGSGDYINCGSNSSLDIGTSDWSFSCWFKTTASLSSSSNLYTIFANGSSATAGIDIILRGSTLWNGILVRLCDGSSYYDFKPDSDLSSTINNGAWHHLAVTIDRDGNLVIYLDASAVKTKSITAYSAKNFYSSYDHKIGVLNFGYSFDGTLDEIGIWKRVLTLAEISQLHNSGAGLSYPFGPTIPVTGVIVAPTSASIAVDGTQQLTASLIPSNATIQNVSWSSSNTSIATVNSSGLITGVASGSATITVTTEDGGFTDECSITVTTSTILVTGVTVAPTSASIAVGGTQQLTASLIPSNATNQNVSWSSSNTSVATVNSSGLVTGVASGSATITVTTEDGGLSATSTVTVTTNSGSDYWQEGTGGIFYDGGNVGVGTSNPEGGLHIATDTYSGLVLQRIANSTYSLYRAQLGISGANGMYGLRIRVSNNNGSTYTDALFVQHDGKVGIGTLAPDVALTVNGDIKAERIDIIADVPSSDHVFNTNYKLMSLHELDVFIKANKHLPEVPSAAEFKENGYSVGEMDDLLLRKIEELTLYIIELEKEIQELKNNR